MASVIQVCNRALQKIGARTISALTDQTPSARACALAYPIVRRAELRKHDWSFSIKRAELAADSPAPDWGRGNSFTVPTDFVRLADDYPEKLGDISGANIGVTTRYSYNSPYLKDWVIEGGKIITNDGDPLQIRYVADIEDPTIWDSLFTEAVSTQLAMQIVETLTQSRSKKADLSVEYNYIMSEAKKANAFESVPNDPPPDTYILVRN